MSAFASVWPVEGVLQAKVTLQAHTQGCSTEGLDAEYLGRTENPGLQAPVHVVELCPGVETMHEYKVHTYRPSLHKVVCDTERDRPDRPAPTGL